MTKRTEEECKEVVEDEAAVAKKLIVLQQQRISKAREEIQAILDKHGLQLQGVVSFTTQEIRIVPR